MKQQKKSVFKAQFLCIIGVFTSNFLLKNFHFVFNGLSEACCYEEAHYFYKAKLHKK